MDFTSALENLYISPLELCNLNCRSCYTTKTKNILSNTRILDFVNRYRQKANLKSIILCGGEVFTLKTFPQLVNSLQSLGLFVTIITNGTIDRLTEINDPQNCQLIVSFDGPEAIHDQNRGQGNFQKSLSFVHHAQQLGFPLEIFYLVTRDSFPYLDSFNLDDIPITYLTDRLGTLTRDQLLHIKHRYPTYPRKNFGCFQISLQSNGLVYACCESSLPIGKIDDDMEKLIANFQQSLSKCNKCREAINFSAHNHPRVYPEGREHGKNSVARDTNICFGCTDPAYLCGYLHELQCPSCPHVIKLFQ